MKSFHFNWLPIYGSFFQQIPNASRNHNVNVNINSPQFATVVSDTTTFVWSLAATGTLQQNGPGNLNFRLVACSNDCNKELLGARLKLEIVNFSDAAKSMVQKSKGDIAGRKSLNCCFQIESCLNDNYTFGTLNKRLKIKGVLKLPTENDRNDKLQQDCGVAECGVKIPTVLDRMLKSVLEEESRDPYADVRLISADGRHFYAHRSVLARQSPVFKTMFESEHFREASDREVNIADVKSDALIEILRYTYTETVSMETLKDVAAEALYAVEKYILPEPFKHQCHQALQETLNLANSVAYLQLADTYRLSELKKCSIEIIVGKFSKVRKEEAWQNLLKNNPTLVDEVYESICNKLDGINMVGIP